jgi:hypothetical protein
VNGQQLFSVFDTMYSVGFAALISDFIGAEFSNFAMA